MTTPRTSDFLIPCATCPATIEVFGGPAFAHYLRTHGEQCTACIDHARTLALAAQEVNHATAH